MLLTPSAVLAGDCRIPTIELSKLWPQPIAMQHFPRPTFDPLIAWGLGCLAFLVAVLWLAQLWPLSRRLAQALASAVLLVTSLAYIGDRLEWFTVVNDFPPRFVLLTVPVLFSFVALGLSRLGRQMAEHLTWSTLIRLQVFRLPLELLMARAALIDVMPIEFSLLGYNFDILTGLGAILLLGLLAWRGSLPMVLIRVWNLGGIACLLMIGLLAILTSPAVHGFGPDLRHLNTWVLFFPYSLLPLILVGFACLGHIVLSRKLNAQKKLTQVQTFGLNPEQTS